MAIHFLGSATDFEGSPNALPDCVMDARKWHKILKPFIASSTLTLGRKDSREGFLKSGRKWLDRLEPGDLGVLLFSQHGGREKINGKWHEFIVFDDLEVLYDFESRDLLAGRPRRTTIVILGDVCHFAGMVDGARPLKSDRSPAKKIPALARTIPLSRCKTHKAKPPEKVRAIRNAIVYAGCKADEYSYSTGKGGAMSLAMQKAFSEREMDCTFGWLGRRVAGKNGLLPTDEWPQTPQVTASADNLRRTLRSFT